MRPQEIQQLKAGSPVLARALTVMRGRVWRLLREGVFVRFPAPAGIAQCCGRCDRTILHTFKSPYNSWHPGWCIDCILQAFYDDESLYNPYRDPEAPEYDERYDRECQLWEDFLEEPKEDEDGPPMAFA